MNYTDPITRRIASKAFRTRLRLTEVATNSIYKRKYGLWESLTLRKVPPSRHTGNELSERTNDLHIFYTIKSIKKLKDIHVEGSISTRSRVQVIPAVQVMVFRTHPSLQRNNSLSM